MGAPQHMIEANACRIADKRAAFEANPDALRRDAEALVKAAVWLGRRAELVLANLRDLRLDATGTDALAGLIEAQRLARDFEALAIAAGVGAGAIAEASR